MICFICYLLYYVQRGNVWIPLGGFQTTGSSSWQGSSSTLSGAQRTSVRPKAVILMLTSGSHSTNSLQDKHTGTKRQEQLQMDRRIANSFSIFDIHGYFASMALHGLAPNLIYSEDVCTVRGHSESIAWYLILRYIIHSEICQLWVRSRQPKKFFWS